jgi:hypothetical protein
VLTVQPRGGLKGQEELATVGARAPVGHAEQTALIVLDARIELAIVLVAGAPAALTARIAALGHEAGDDPVKDRAVVEAETGQVDRARDVHGGNVGHEAHDDRTLVGLEPPAVALFGIEAQLRRLGQLLLPARF